MEYIYQLPQLNLTTHSADGTMTKPFLERLHIYIYAKKTDVVHRIMELSALPFANGLSTVNWLKDTQVKEYNDFYPISYVKIFIRHQ